MVVDHNKLDLIMHPIFEKLIKVKWDKFGRKGAVKQLIINFLFVISWTTQALSEASETRNKYTLPDDLWKIALYVSTLNLNCLLSSKITIMPLWQVV